MDVLELVEVETRLADLVLAQFLQQGGLLLQFAVQVEHQILFAGREADVEPVSLARLAAVMETAKADDCLSPHDGRLPGKLLHQLQHTQAIGVPLLVGDAGKKLVDAGIVFLCASIDSFFYSILGTTELSSGIQYYLFDYSLFPGLYTAIVSLPLIGLKRVRIPI